MPRPNARSTCSFASRKRARQIKRPFLARIVEAKPELRVGELLFFAKNLFDLPAQVIPRAVQLARNGGLVFAEQLADLREA